LQLILVNTNVYSENAIVNIVYQKNDTVVCAFVLEVSIGVFATCGV